LKIFSASLNFTVDIFPILNFFFIIFFILLQKFNFDSQFKFFQNFLTYVILFCIWILMKYLRIIIDFTIYFMVFSQIKVQSIFGLHLESFLNYLFNKIFLLLISFYFHFKKLFFSLFISFKLNLNYHHYILFFLPLHFIKLWFYFKNLLLRMFLCS